MATFNDLVTRICARLNKNVNDATVTTRIKTHVNAACEDGWNSFPWTFRYREYLLPLIADINSNTTNAYTATATNASQSVTLSSGFLPDTTTFVGGYIRFTADSIQTFYRIVACPSTSSLTIEPAYQGTSGASKQFFLKKLDWLFPSEMVDVKMAAVPPYSYNLPVYWNVDPPDVTYGIPAAVYIYNSDYIGSTYTTGTLSGSINTNTLTGSGTAWLANVTPGDTITITGDSATVGAQGSVLTRYTVYKVVSDTSIVLYQNLLTTPAGATYTSTKQFGRFVRLQPSPNQPWGLMLGGRRKYQQLINNNDTNEMLFYHTNAVVEDAVWREMQSSPDSRDPNQFQVKEKAWTDAKSEDRALTQHRVARPVFSNRPSR